MLRRPGGELAARPLHFIWIADCSGSMLGAKIEVLNRAIEESIPAMRQSADENPNAEVLVRAIKFSDGANWHVATSTAVADFKWPKLTAGGVTDMGKALSMVAAQLKSPPMPDRGLPPVLVLISDGQPTDDFSKGLKELMAEPWGVKSVRIAIAIGGDADLGVLERFIGNPEIKPVVAHSAADLVRYIKWASTVLVKAASAPPVAAAASGSPSPAGSGAPAAGSASLPGAVNVPPPPPPSPSPSSAADIW